MWKGLNVMKVRLTVEENVRYTAEIIIEQPETLSNADLEVILESVESRCKSDQAKSIAYLLEHEHGIKIIEVNDNFPDSPSDSELEIIDVSDVKE